MDLVPSTLEQRESFYKEEFDIEKVKAWFEENKIGFPQLVAVDCGTDTGIIKDKNRIGKIISLKAVDLKNKFMGYLPEDVYYDRNLYRDPDSMLDSLDFKGVWHTDNLLGQELAFDLDPENIKCTCEKICDKCMKKSVEKSVELAERLKGRYKKVSLVYSGRGMHVHVFDEEASKLSIVERDHLNERFKEFPIDHWVSKGYIRLIRLPYSLHGGVSRIALPLTIKEAESFDPSTDERAIPKFLKI